MGKVKFINSNTIRSFAIEAFHFHKKKISGDLPNADIQHIGSTAIPNSLTKGDLDIQVRVSKDDFLHAVGVLSELYETNEGSVKTNYFRAFKDDECSPPLGIQLTIIGSELDFFWKFRDVLLENDEYNSKYNNLKGKFDNEEMEKYREAKGDFFKDLMNTPEYKRLDK